MIAIALSERCLQRFKGPLIAQNERERETEKMSASYIRIDCSCPAGVAVGGGGENKFSIFYSLFGFSIRTLDTVNAVETRVNAKPEGGGGGEERGGDEVRRKEVTLGEWK